MIRRLPWLFCLLSCFVSLANGAEKRPPNVVVIFLDDSGWGDFQPFGKPDYNTPNVAQLAAEGCRFNNFYVPQAICSASRSALLSGCYPGRTKMFGAHGPNARGLDPKFATLGEVMKEAGYTTAVFGKWHIGDQPETRPPARGFDESCGLMYSNDMWEFHPGNPKFWGRFPLKFWENGKVTNPRVTKEHQPFLTTWYTEHAVDFIGRHKNKPFFLYVPHSMPHVPLFVSEKFAGKSGAGLYGDVMMEIDWSVGQINNALKNAGIEDDTLVVFTSDTGPWVSYGKRAGVTPFKEAKATSFDGGVRSACVMKFPGRIKPSSTSDATMCTIDLMPTICKLTGAKLPKNPIDGNDVWDLIVGKEGAKNDAEYYPFSTGGTFEGVISGDGHWKLHVPHRFRTLNSPGKDGLPGRYDTVTIGYALFDMKNDPYEKVNVLTKYPEIAKKMVELAEAHRVKFFAKQKAFKLPAR